MAVHRGGGGDGAGPVPGPRRPHRPLLRQQEQIQTRTHPRGKQIVISLNQSGCSIPEWQRCL